MLRACDGSIVFAPEMIGEVLEAAIPETLLSLRFKKFSVDSVVRF
jgi:hypothetical protein